MAVRPPKRPAPVAALGSQQAQGVGEDTGEATDRALGAIVDAIENLRQRLSAPTVNRITLNDLRPLTNVPGSVYTDGTDLWFLDFDGNRIQLTANGAVNATSGGGGTTVAPSTYWYSPVWTAGNALDTRGPTNDQCRAIYMGRAPTSLTEIDIAWGQTAGGTITYAEMGIATGTMVPMSTPSLVLRGYVDATVNWGSSGNRVMTIPVTGTAIAAGEDIWACYSVSFSAGAPTIAVSNVSDRVDSGAIVRRNATRISTNLNTSPLAFVLDPSATPPWIAFAL